MFPPTVANLEWLSNYSTADDALAGGEAMGLPETILPRMKSDAEGNVGIAVQEMPTTTRCRRQNSLCQIPLIFSRKSIVEQQESSLRTHQVHRPRQPVAQHRSRCDRQWIASTQQLRCR